MRKLGHWIAPIVVIVGLVLLMFDAKATCTTRFALRAAADQLRVRDDLGRRHPWPRS